MSLAAGSLNHLLLQNPWARERLRAYAGKTVSLELIPFQSRLTIDENGGFIDAADDAAADAGVSFMPSAAMRWLSGDEIGNDAARLEGDPELAAEVSQVLRRLQWEYEEDLSRLVGDIAAHELVGLARDAAREGRQQLLGLAGMCAEYWQEERPLIAGKQGLQRFAAEVAALHEDAARLAQRIKLLEQRL